MHRALAALLLSIGLAVAAGSSAVALLPVAPPAETVGGLIARVQVGPGGLINPGRDCQTVRQCRFTRGGDYRGCISAYSCRACRFVAAPCTITGAERTCRRLRCDWGG